MRLLSYNQTSNRQGGKSNVDRCIFGYVVYRILRCVWIKCARAMVEIMLIALWVLAAAGIAVLIWGLYEIVVNDMVIGG